MAPRRDDLPVAAEAYRLAEALLPAVGRMPRALRSILGGEIVKETVGLCACLHEASLHATRLDALARADVHLTRLRVLLRMAFDQRALAPAAYETSAERVAAVGRMLGGWIRRARAPPAPRGET